MDGSMTERRKRKNAVLAHFARKEQEQAQQQPQEQAPEDSPQGFIDELKKDIGW